MSDTPPPSSSEAASAYNRRLGLVLFAIYCAVYAGFIALAVASRQTLAAPAIFGINLAVTYGMALIAGAGVMSALYLLLARDGES